MCVCERECECVCVCVQAERVLEYGKCGMVISNLYDRARARSKVPLIVILIIICKKYSLLF